ncbi:2-C-methyl-D-erythritol 4-phosphate cytidylyltransferase [Bradyrhizobium japonicum]
MAAERLHADDTTVPVLDLRRPFFAMADIEENARRKAAGKKAIPLSPIAVEVVRRIDALFEIERSINGRSAEERVQVADAEPSLGR